MFTLPFSQISSKDSPIAGGKGASLGEMTRADIPVPPGFVVLTTAFDRFLQDNNLNEEIEATLRTVDHHAVHTVENASEQITSLIGASEMPKEIRLEILTSFRSLDARFVAVRSSATAEDGTAAAWAGQLESYLNTTEETLLKNIQLCWASLFSPRAIFYRFEKGLRSRHISMAVVVQTMVDSDVAGVAFSVHPVTRDTNSIVVEAALGLGEAVVSGSVTPDSYIVTKNPVSLSQTLVSVQSRAIERGPDGGTRWRTLTKSEGKKQKLDNDTILALASLVVQLEQHYGFPVDVEWALTKDNLFALQCRPITTLKPPPVPADTVHIREQDWFLAVTRNMSFWHQNLMTQSWYKDMPAFGIDARLELLSVTMNGTQSHCFLRHENNDLFLRQLVRTFTSPTKLRALRGKIETHGAGLLNTLQSSLRAPTENSVRKFLTAYQTFVASLQITTGFGRHGTELLQTALREHGLAEDKIGPMLSIISYPKEHTPLFSSQRDMLVIADRWQRKKIASTAALRKQLDLWLRHYANIPVNYCDEPWTLRDARQQLKTMLARDCAAELRSMEKAHKERLFQRRKQLKTLNNTHINTLADALAACTYLNEWRKNIISTTSLRYRPLFRHVASLCGSNEWRDCFFLHPDEMLSAFQGERIPLASLKKKRKNAGLIFDDRGKAVLLDTSETETLLQIIRAKHGSKKADTPVLEVLKGMSANPGKVQGHVKVVLNSAAFGKFKTGDILVTTMTSVDFVPIMDKAAAFVTNEGGITTHAAIVAREMNKPCILATKTATRDLRDGDLVEVDADKGEVRVLKRAGSTRKKH